MNRPILRRSAVSFVAWSSVSGRSKEISSALGGDSRCFYDFGFVDPRLVPFRYIASALRTVFYLIARRPRAVIASNPPIFPGLIAYLYSRISGARVVLDSHPSSFGLEENSKVVKLTMPLQRFLVPRVAGTIVTEDSLAKRVGEEGGRGEVVHEAQPEWSLPPAPPLPARPKVLLVGIFAPDEPVHLVVDAARDLADVDFQITGDLRRCPEGLRRGSPPNVHFVGFLDQDAYLEAIAGANVVMTLTERPEDVSRVASEAVSAKRPLIMSDWPAARRYFPHAVAVPNTAAGVTTGVARALREYDALVESTGAALAEQEDRWQSQLATLRSLVAA